MDEPSVFYNGVRTIQTRILQVAGLLCLKDRPLNSALSLLTSGLVHLAFVVLSSMYINAISQDIASKRFNPDITSELVSFIGFHLRFFYIFGRREKLGRMMKYADELWLGLRPEEKALVRSFVRKVSLLSGFYCATILVTITLYVLSSLQPQIAGANGTAQRELPYPFFVDVQDSPYYELAILVEVVSLLTVSQTSVCVDMTIAFLIMIACGHFRLIRLRVGRIARRIEEVEEARQLGSPGARLDKDAESIRQTLRDCVAYHVKIVCFCKDIATLSSEIFMIELISTTYNISLIGILLVGDMPLTEKLRFLQVLFILTTQLFVCQYPPDVLLQESAGVADAAYFVPPFRRDKYRIDSLLLTLLTRSQIPYQLLAGGQIKLSIESFGNMIRGAVSFFTVLRNFN